MSVIFPPSLFGQNVRILCYWWLLYREGDNMSFCTLRPFSKSEMLMGVGEELWFPFSGCRDWGWEVRALKHPVGTASLAMPQGLELPPLLVHFFSFPSALTWGGAGRHVPPGGPLTPAEDTLSVANNNSLCLNLNLFLTFLPSWKIPFFI